MISCPWMIMHDAWCMSKIFVEVVNRNFAKRNIFGSCLLRFFSSKRNENCTLYKRETSMEGSNDSFHAHLNIAEPERFSSTPWHQRRCRSLYARKAQPRQTEESPSDPLLARGSSYSRAPQNTSSLCSATVLKNNASTHRRKCAGKCTT